MTTEEQLTDDPLDCAFIEMSLPEGWQQGTSDKDGLRHRGKIRHKGFLLPLEQKIDHAKKVITSALNRDVRWAVSYSGGGDSTVLSYILVKLMGVEAPHVFSDTRMEYPEPLQQVKEWRAWLKRRGVPLYAVRSKMMPSEVWEYGLPIGSKMIASKARQYQATGNLRHLDQLSEDMRKGVIEATKAGWPISEKCCDILKKKPMKEWDKKNNITGHFTGIRAAESEARKLAWLQRGALYHSARNNQWLCHPLAYWSSQDISEFMEAAQDPIQGPTQQRTQWVSGMWVRLPLGCVPG